MLFNGAVKRARKHLHPYLAGNFAPVHRIFPLTPCTYSGTIPRELAGGQYVRNGGNPLTNEDLGRDAHWFDGDGMLSGVLFRRTEEKGTEIQPEFVNQYILTDVYLASRGSKDLRTPILPSIATLVNPLSSVFTICWTVLRTLLLVFLSHLPGSSYAIKRISVANTGIYWHDGRALATCESGPPIRVQLPRLQTVGWFNGRRVEGEIDDSDSRSGYGGTGPLSFMKEWTTGHPRVDPHTNELITFHSTFAPPYVHYSIVPATQSYPGKAPLMPPQPTLNLPIPGVSGARMMHDFGVAREHTIILDLPLSLNPLNLVRGQPVVSYNSQGRSRFGVFPRHLPEQIQWFETNACCIFHTANTWETTTKAYNQQSFAEQKTLHLLTCRLTSASLIFSAGDIATPQPIAPIPPHLIEEEQCRLYYYRFPLSSSPTTPNAKPRITHQWALSTLPFEFPTVRDSVSMSAARYIYGCSASGTFSAALGRAAKIDYLAKIDVQTLISRGEANPPEQIRGAVDTRSADEILASANPDDPIQLFKMPAGWYAQEPRFVPRAEGAREDDGWLLTYVFDESQLDAATGECKPNAASELWVIDARSMRDVVARIRLPARVPYGLHGNWFSEAQVASQRGVRTFRGVDDKARERGRDKERVRLLWRAWMVLRRRAERILG